MTSDLFISSPMPPSHMVPSSTVVMLRASSRFTVIPANKACYNLFGVTQESTKFSKFSFKKLHLPLKSCIAHPDRQTGSPRQYSQSL